MVPILREWRKTGYGALALLGNAECELGRWDELLETGRGVVEWDRKHGPTQVAMLVIAHVAHVRLLRGEVDEAAALMDEFLDPARQMRDPQLFLPVLLVAAETKRLQGHDAAALDLLREFESETVNRGFWRATYCNGAVRLAHAEARTGSVSES